MCPRRGIAYSRVVANVDSAQPYGHTHTHTYCPTDPGAQLGVRLRWLNWLWFDCGKHVCGTNYGFPRSRQQQQKQQNKHLFESGTRIWVSIRFECSLVHFRVDNVGSTFWKWCDNHCLRYRRRHTARARESWLIFQNIDIRASLVEWWIFAGAPLSWIISPRSVSIMALVLKMSIIQFWVNIHFRRHSTSLTLEWGRWKFVVSSTLQAKTILLLYSDA